jgi:L-lactate dehydrogenase
MTEISRRTKVTVVGAGSVGATIAFASQIRGVANTLAIYDLNAKKTRAEVLDMNHGKSFVPPVEVIGSDDPEVTAGSDIIVVTAGAKQKPGQTRLDLAGANVNMMKKLGPQLLDLSPNAVFCVVTNPCDVVTYATMKVTGLPPNRVFGSGTVLDSARLRYLIGEFFNVNTTNVHAYIAGEHGDSEIALWSSATIGATPLVDFEAKNRPKMTPEDRKRIHDEVVNAAYEIIQGKGATWYGVGLAVTRILEAFFNDAHTILPVSSLLTDYQGISDVVLSVPSIVDRFGVQTVLDVPLDDEELAGLRSSGDEVRSVARSLGL